MFLRKALCYFYLLFECIFDLLWSTSKYLVVEMCNENKLSLSQYISFVFIASFMQPKKIVWNPNWRACLCTFRVWDGVTLLSHHSCVHLIRPHSLCVRHRRSVAGCMSRQHTWAPAAHGRRAESDLLHLKHVHTVYCYCAECQPVT